MDIRAVDKIIRDSENLDYFYVHKGADFVQVPMAALFGAKWPVNIIFPDDELGEEEIEEGEFYACGVDGVYDQFIEGTACHLGGRWYKTETGWKYIEPYWYSTNNVQTYEHDQGTPSDEWIINHPMQKKPSVVVIDSAGTEVKGLVTYININQLKINFSAAFSGKAVLN